MAHNVGDNLLVGETEREGSPVSVFQAEQDVQPATPRLIQQLLGHQSGHKEFHTANTVSLFPHNLLDFADDAPAEWQVNIDTRCLLTNKSASQQQLVADELRFCWHLAQSRHEIA
jgi:hypothetical protein